MLYQVDQSTKGGTNVYITDLLNAMANAIYIESADGEQELPDMLVTAGGDSHTLINIFSRDGVQYRVYDSIQVVAPNPVTYEGKQLQHVSDWVQVILEMTKTNRWPASDEPQTKRGTRGNASLMQKYSTWTDKSCRE